MEKLSRGQILTLPNGLTIARILIIPLIIVLLFYGQPIYQMITAVLFLFAVVTDTFDGYLARRRRMVTTLGTFLDPLADKLLIVATLIGLITARGIPAWMVIVIVGREIAVTGLRGIAVSQGIVISASHLGKYKMCVEGVSVFCLILNGDYFAINFYRIGIFFLWAAMFLAIVSGYDYFKKFLKEMIA